ncbi:uncharacterized protein UTRI_03078 [Ustilago trichophora]|uniref:Uncharacterized protein n=1 Tax=Ustilago trichophora TaxID=86804 RepID=A0A5C3E4R8_9BASI|nr:uncharacterized protein UTRI_03078 [Ustilago trichophora]
MSSRAPSKFNADDEAVDTTTIDKNDNTTTNNNNNNNNIITTTTTATMTPAAPKKGHHRRTSSLLPSLNSLGSFLASAGGLASTNTGQEGTSSPSSIPQSNSGGLSTDAELMISHPSPTEWADEMSPVKARSGWDSTRASSRTTQAQHRATHRNLSEEVRFRGQTNRMSDNNTSSNQSFIAFPSPTSPTMTEAQHSERPVKQSLGSTTSSAASTALDSDRLIHSPEPSTSTFSSTADTPATSVRYSPTSTPKEMPECSPLFSPSPPPPSDTTVKADNPHSSSSARYPTLPRSFTASRSPASYAKGPAQETNARASALGRTSSLSAATGRCTSNRLDDVLSSDEKSVQRQSGFRARSINSIRGLAAAWVPARFAPTSQPSSSASSSSSNDDSSSLGAISPRRRDGLALAPMSSIQCKEVARHGATDAKRPVKLDRRRLDKAVSLAVEAAQAAEEDERLWEEKRAKKAAQITASPNTSARPALKAAWSSSSRSSNEDSRQLTCFAGNADVDTGLTSEDEHDEEEDDGLGFSLDLYISSLGYLISAISDKEAPGLSSKQRQDIRQRLEEGMAKLGFDAKAELEKAEAMKRELELEREKLQLQRQHNEASPTANVIHHHYHTAVPANSSVFGDANFSRAHAAAKASSRGSSSLAGKISSSVLDIGLHIGAGALSALSANLSAIAPRAVRRGSAGSVSSSKDKGMDDLRITDLDNDEDLQGMPAIDASPRLSSSQPGSGAATPRTAWTRAISQNNKQWELAVAFASTAASALASSLGAVARSEAASDSPSTTVTSSTGTGPLTHEQQLHLARYGHLEGNTTGTQGAESAEDRLILLSASLARALKRSPLPTQLYQLLRQMVSILAAIDAKYSLSQKGTQLAVRETSRAMRFVRRHDLHVKAVRVAWAAAEAAVAALEAYRDEKGWNELQQQQKGRIAAGESTPTGSYSPFTARMGGNTPIYSGSPPKEGKMQAAIEDKRSLEAKIDDAEAQILAAAEGKTQHAGQRA